MRVRYVSTYVIQDEVGLHARPAGLLAKEAKKYASEIKIASKGKEAEAGKIMALMALGVKKGEEVVITVAGPDEEMAAAELELFLMR